MKKIIVLFVLVFTSVSLSPVTVLADIIPPNSHYVKVCSKIVNLDKFPNLVLVGYVGKIASWNMDPYKIENQKCLEKGYKLSYFGIYWTTKDKFKSIDLSNLKLIDGANKVTGENYVTIENLNYLSSNVEFSNYFSDTDKVTKKVVEYSIIASTDGIFTLHKTKQISEYDDGTPQKIETFNNPVEKKEQNKIIPKEALKQIPNPSPVIPLPQPTERGFWRSFGCFIMSLFGGSC